ncbi:MAG: PAS domain-containing protein [Coleofasciculaceae cyanobacterium SM2_1_6]|nr:PAS domain-containing protein [Coleofasciculaceae cyanobacterium SM2_1_6]
MLTNQSPQEVTPGPAQRRRSIPLKLILIAPFILQIFAAVALTGYFSIRNGQESVNNLAGQLRKEVTMRVNNYLVNFMAKPVEINQMNTNAISLGVTNHNDQKELLRNFWNQSRSFGQTVPLYIYFGNPAGGFAGAGIYELEDKVAIEYTENFRAGDYYSYIANEIGYPTTQPFYQEGAIYESNYDARQRPWYSQALAANQAIWTEVYVYSDGNLGTTAAQPVYDRASNLLGVVAVDFSLVGVSKFLRQVKIGKSGTIFIVERNGLLVSSSTTEDPYVKVSPEETQRLKAIDSSIPIIRQSTLVLQEKFKDLATINDAQQLKFMADGQSQFASVTPFKDQHGLDWLIVVIVPEADFIGQINENTRTTIFLCLLALTIATISGIYTSRWISMPIVALNQVSRSITAGDFTQTAPASQVQELDSLASSFNQMSGQLQQSYAQLRDYSQSLEQKVQERTEALRISEERFQLTMESVKDGIWDWYLDTNEVYFSPQWKLILGYADHELVNAFSTWEQLLHPEDVAPSLAGVEEHLKDPSSAFSLEFRMRHKNGDYRWILSRAKVVAWDDRGQPRRLVGSHTDISDRKIVELELQNAKQLADNANQAKSEFLANMSHELRTPLNGILGYAQILRRSKAIPEQDHHGIRTIYQCGTHLLTLINDILDISNIETKKLELVPQAIHLPSLLQGVRETSQIHAQQKSIELRYEPDENLPIGVIVDEKRLRQVLINLLGNATKFTDQGVVTFKVQLLNPHTHQNKTAQLRFTITDTGIGIAPENIDKLFRAFEKVGDRSRQAEGTGLGLAISQQIIRLMGGQIQVQSQLGVGSEFFFTVELPLHNEWIQPSGGAEKNIVGYGGVRKQILVVDDRGENRAIIINLLEPLGFIVLEAATGQQGLDKIRETLPDLVIIDLQIPDMDGLALVKQLRRDRKLPHLKILVSSASLSLIDQQRSLAAGGDEFLVKPVNAGTLFNTLARHLQITWIYEEEAELTPVVDTPASDLVVPPPRELEVLLELAQEGRLKKLIEVARQLGQQDDRYQPFVQQVVQLAKQFQSEKIEQLLQQYLTVVGAANY